MEILQVCAFAAEQPGNFIASLTSLANKLLGMGYNTVYVFPERAREKCWCKELGENSKVYFLPEEKARILPRTYSVLRRIFRENDIVIAHSHFELYDIPLTLTAPKSVRVFWHLHDPIQDGYQKANMSRRLLTRFQYGWLGRRVIMLTVSKKHGDFVKKMGFPEENMMYVPNGIDTNKIKTVHLHDEQNVLRFLHLGWDVYRKGVDVIIDAIPLIERQNYNVFIVGLEKCKSYLEQNFRSGIFFVEPVKDINELFEKSDVFLHISRSEGQSYALLEAIYAGLPVICSNIPENEFAMQFRNVYWVEVGNPKDLAHSINSQLISFILPSIADINYNKSIIEERYSISSWVNQITKHYGV